MEHNILYDLFEPDVVEVFIDDLDNIDFAFFSKNKNVLSLQFINTIQKFIDLKKEKYFYHLNPYFNTFIKSNEYRFLIIVRGNTKWFIPYKIVQIVKTKQIRFFDIPISNTKNYSCLDDENLIIKKLSKKDFVKFVFQSSFIDYYKPFRNIKRLENSDEFYYDISSENSIFLSSKWKKAHYINQILKLEDFNATFSDSVIIKDTIKLREKWKIGMANKNDNVRISTERYFNNFIKQKNENIKVISLFYKGEMIAQEFFLLDNKKRIAESVYCNHIFDYHNEQKLKRIVNRMVAIQKYYSWYFMNKICDVVFVGTGANKHLYEHKKRTCDGVIEYYIC